MNYFFQYFGILLGFKVQDVLDVLENNGGKVNNRILKKMKQYFKIIIISFYLIFLNCCNDNSKECYVKNNDKKELSEENYWIKDSLGCLSLRTLDTAKKIIKTNDLLRKDKKIFVDFFGAPNDFKKGEEHEILIYFIESRCKDGILVKESDVCWVEFIFDIDGLTDIPVEFSCE